MASKKEVAIMIKATDKASKVLTTVGQKGQAAMKGLAAAAAAVTAAYTALSAAITALVTLITVKSVQAFAQFEHEMANIATLVIKNSEGIIAGLSKGVRELSTLVPQATTVLTKSLYDLISAGIPASQSLDALEESARAAVGGSTSVAIASNLATNTINAFGLAASKMGDIFDTAFATVRVGVVTFEQLGTSMSNAIAPAAKLDLGLTELFGSVAFLTKVGLSADEATTSLGRALEDLGKEEKKLKKFGVNVFGATGEFEGLLNVMEQLAGVLNKLSAQERKDVLEEMGLTEIRSQRALIPMITNIETFRSIIEDVEDRANATGVAYEKMVKTMKNQWGLLANAMQELKVTIGEGFGDIALAAMESVRGLVNAVSVAIKGSGGLNQLWENHTDYVVAAFDRMLSIVPAIVSAMLDILGVLIKAKSKTIFQNIWLSFQQSIDKMFHTMYASRKLFTKGLEGYLDEMELVGIAMEKEAEALGEKQREVTKETIRAIIAEVKELGAESKKIMDDMQKEFDAVGREYVKLKNTMQESMVGGEDPFAAMKKAAKDAGDEIDDALGGGKAKTNVQQYWANQKAAIIQEQEFRKQEYAKTIAKENVLREQQRQQRLKDEVEGERERREMAYQSRLAENVMRAQQHWANIKEEVERELVVRREAYERRVALHAEYMKEIEDSERNMTQVLIEFEQFRADTADTIRQNSYEAESDRIREMRQLYMTYVGDAINIGKILFNSQKVGWMRTLAALIRYGSQMLAEYLRNRALEKLRQADELHTQAMKAKGFQKEMGYYAGLLLALAAYGEAKALIFGDAAAQAGAAIAATAATAALAGGLAAGGMAEKLEKDAKQLQAEAAGLMAASVAVEAAGEIAATGLEMAAEAADEAARKEQQLADNKQRALDEEFRIRQQILELEGKGSEAKLLALDAELQKYRDMGLDQATLSRWYDLQQAQILGEMGAETSVAPTTTAGGGISGGGIPTSTGSTINVYQTNNFAGFLDTANREQLRELAIMLQPFIKEVEDLETNP